MQRRLSAGRRIGSRQVECKGAGPLHDQVRELLVEAVGAHDHGGSPLAAGPAREDDVHDDDVASLMPAAGWPAAHQAGMFLHPGKGPSSIDQPVDDFASRTARRLVSDFSFATSSSCGSVCSGGWSRSGIGHRRSV